MTKNHSSNMLKKWIMLRLASRFEVTITTTKLLWEIKTKIQLVCNVVTSL